MSLNFEEYSNEFEQALKRKIPRRFRDAKISNDDIKSYMMGEYNNFSRGLYIYGDCGTGKTYNLYGIYKLLLANEILTKNHEEGRITTYFPPSKVINITEFFSELKQTFDDNDSEQKIVDLISTWEVLLIDDFGTEKLSDWTIEACYRLINHRYAEMKPTFFSSNLSLEEIAKRMGDRFASRIAEMCKVIKIDGEDRRLKTG